MQSGELTTPRKMNRYKIPYRWQYQNSAKRDPNAYQLKIDTGATEWGSEIQQENKAAIDTYKGQSDPGTGASDDVRWRSLIHQVKQQVIVFIAIP